MHNPSLMAYTIKDIPTNLIAKFIYAAIIMSSSIPNFLLLLALQQIPDLPVPWTQAHYNQILGSSWRWQK
jgi:hypothetical protein